jgi:hypothetical protein
MGPRYKKKPLIRGFFLYRLHRGIERRNSNFH